MNLSPGQIINNQIQAQPSKCKPEICMNCSKKFYCQNYVQFLEGYIYGGVPNITSNNTQQTNVPTQNQDMASLLNIMENFQNQISILANEINNIKTTPVSDNVVTEDNAEESLEYSETQNSLQLIDEQSGIAVINDEDMPDKVLVQKKTIFGNTKWVEQKPKT